MLLFACLFAPISCHLHQLVECLLGLNAFTIRPGFLISCLLCLALLSVPREGLQDGPLDYFLTVTPGERKLDQLSLLAVLVCLQGADGFFQEDFLVVSISGLHANLLCALLDLIYLPSHHRLRHYSLVYL